MRVAEEFVEGLAAIERRVVLARHEAHVLDLELADDLLELGKALAAQLRVVGGMRQVAGEHDEVRRLGQAVDGGDGFFQGAFGIGIGRALEAPV